MGQCYSGPSTLHQHPKESSSSSSSFRTRCLPIAKEQRSRLYIIRRCIFILICWHKYKDSDRFDRSLSLH
ncbi:hypothetical protein CDL12_13781 [Handroanthus impetiginosus]|uniref:Uncharacterized protein n=1 Tax=Handroanthus impetiginosus TaxID=429701 RepID=A0A2G9H7U1_9LAMI|nr:hypothetical protein CDL12_13781 [Handroanthus impetiginosus]